MRAGDLEDVLKNPIEQILPTLATKGELTALATREDVNGVKVLIEDPRGTVAIIAAHVADISQRLPPRA